MFAIICKSEHDEEKRWTEKRTGFISWEYDDMNLEKMYILNFILLLTLRPTGIVILWMDHSTSGCLNILTFRSHTPSK